jgi:hypothetical protein
VTCVHAGGPVWVAASAWTAHVTAQAPALCIGWPADLWPAGLWSLVHGHPAVPHTAAPAPPCRHSAPGAQLPRAVRRSAAVRAVQGGHQPAPALAPARQVPVNAGCWQLGGTRSAAPPQLQHNMNFPAVSVHPSLPNYPTQPAPPCTSLAYPPVSWQRSASELAP